MSALWLWQMLVSRAVLCRHSKAIDMSRDHNHICIREKKRIIASRGNVYDGYLNGQLNELMLLVLLETGSWSWMDSQDPRWRPLSSEPEFMTTKQTGEDKLLIIGCDGIWDVFMNHNAVDFARRKPQEHNDPVLCSKELVDEALKRKCEDNLSAVVFCFQSQPPPNLIVSRGLGDRECRSRSVSAEGLKSCIAF